MTLPFTLPDWLPGWAFLLLALPVLLYALAFALMPFSVFGVKARLEAMETQLNEIHDELRGLAWRNAGVTKATESYDDVPNFARLKSSQASYAEPPQAAPPFTPVVEPRAKPFVPQPPERPIRRTEPRLD